MPTKEDVWQALIAAFPEPDDTDAYVPALYFSQMTDALAVLSKIYADAFRDAVYRIRKDGLTSDIYTIVEHFRETRRVRLDMVREDYPEVYSELVHLDGRTAQSILGASVLFKQCIDEAGEEEVLKKALITVKDLEEALGEEYAAPYMDVKRTHDFFEVVVK
ncbi:MAG: hypothetical protein IKY77_02840 [Methanocorpusculaceae archaeon]|nr:hypothetical protein [Methanocorpusculaceae archaeon]